MNYYDVLAGIITVAIALGLFYGVWQTYVIDQTRQKLYEHRDRLFDLGIEHPEYRATNEYQAARDWFNAAARFTHELNIPTLIALVFSKVPDEEMKIKVVPSLDNKEVEHEIGIIMNDSFAETTLCLVRRSMLMILLVPVALVGILIIHGSYGFYRGFRSLWFEKLSSIVLAEDRRRRSAA